MELPLFPLHTVLFPGGVLPLRIFEPRYLDMVSRCLKSGSGFVVVAIREGQEVGKAAACHEVGTLARVVDFDRLQTGLLGITCRGETRLRIVSQRVQSDQLVLGQAESLPAEPSVSVPEWATPLAAFLKTLLEREEMQTYCRFLTPDWEQAGWLGARLTEILPLPLPVKQSLLLLEDPLQRLEILYAAFEEMRVI